jgi:hypothetical protein
MAEASAKPPSLAPTPSPHRKKNRAEFLAWLEQERPTRGEAWYNDVVARMRARDALRDQAWRESRELAQRQWTDQVTAWSAAGGFEAVAQALCGGPASRIARTRFQYRIAGVKFEVNLANRTCTRWDGDTFANGKRGKREALGLATAVFELQGEPKPFLRAKEVVISLSRIAPERGVLTGAVKRRLEEMRRQQEELARKMAEEADREQPLSAEDQAVAPVRITDPAKLEELTHLMARERAYPLDYARRAVAEAVIWFGEWQYRDRESGDVVNSHRPIAVSDVIGMETGALLGHASREFRTYFRGPAKGKNLGRIQNGFVVIGKWGPETKRVIITEGVYSGLALRLLRERRQRPLAPEEAILVPAGSRELTRLLKFCQRKGLEVISAHDCDPAGFKTAHQNDAWCREHGVKHTIGLPPLGEVTLSFRDDDWGRAQYLEVIGRLSSTGQQFAFLPAAAGRLQLVARTTAEVCELFGGLKRAARELGETEFQAWLEREHPPKAGNGVTSARDPDALYELQLQYERRHPLHEPLREQWHRKDWNELLQHEYRPRARTANGLPEAAGDAAGELQEYLRGLGLRSEEIQALLEAGTVYAAELDGSLQAIWPTLPAESPTPLGFMAKPLAAGRIQAYGAVSTAALSVGVPAEASCLVLTGSLGRVFEAWRAEGTAASVILVTGEHLPASYLDLAGKQALPVACDFADDDWGRAHEARVVAAVRTRGLKLREPGARKMAPAIAGP